MNWSCATVMQGAKVYPTRYDAKELGVHMYTRLHEFEVFTVP